MISVKTSTYNFRGERKADILRVNTTRNGLRSFRSEAPRIWNSLPNNLRVAESYSQFRGLLRRWDGLGCGCPLCCAYFLLLFFFFFFAFLLMCYRALLCFTCVAFAFHNKFYPLSHPFVHLCLRNFRCQGYLME